METKVKAPHERMKNPAVIIREAMEPIQALYAAVHKGWCTKAHARPRSSSSQPDQWVQFVRAVGLAGRQEGGRDG